MENEQDRIGIDPSEENLRTPNRQRDLATQHAGTQSVEAHTKEYESWNYYTVHIETSLAKYLRDLGDGEITKGVKIVTRFYQSRCEQDK
jgi:hypothetical protein